MELDWRAYQNAWNDPTRFKDFSELKFKGDRGRARCSEGENVMMPYIDGTPIRGVLRREI